MLVGARRYECCKVPSVTRRWRDVLVVKARELERAAIDAQAHGNHALAAELYREAVIVLSSIEAVGAVGGNGIFRLAAAGMATPESASRNHDGGHSKRGEHFAQPVLAGPALSGGGGTVEGDPLARGR